MPETYHFDVEVSGRERTV